MKENQRMQMELLLESPGPKYQGIRNLTTTLAETKQMLQDTEVVIEDLKVQTEVLKTNWIAEFKTSTELKRDIKKRDDQLVKLENQVGLCIREMKEAEIYYLQTTTHQRRMLERQDAELCRLKRIISLSKSVFLLFIFIVSCTVYWLSSEI